eukprot:scaffold13002_cov125-Isochrysis_galbana.AAC.17
MVSSKLRCAGPMGRREVVRGHAHQRATQILTYSAKNTLTPKLWLSCGVAVTPGGLGSGAVHAPACTDAACERFLARRQVGRRGG